MKLYKFVEIEATAFFVVFHHKQHGRYSRQPSTICLKAAFHRDRSNFKKWKWRWSTIWCSSNCHGTGSFDVRAFRHFWWINIQNRCFWSTSIFRIKDWQNNLLTRVPYWFTLTAANVSIRLRYTGGYIKGETKNINCATVLCYNQLQCMILLRWSAQKSCKPRLERTR